MQENLERFGFEQRPQQRHLDRTRCRMLVRPRLQAPAHPLADARILDMHEFRTDGVGVNSLQTGNHLAQSYRLIVEKEFRGNAKIEIRLAETKLAETQQWIARSGVCQRIDACNGVTERAIRVDEAIDARLQCCFAGFGGLSSVALRQVAEFESFEEGRPPRVNRLRIFLPVPVIFFDQLEICPSGNGSIHGKFNLGRLCGAAS